MKTFSLKKTTSEKRNLMVVSTLLIAMGIVYFGVPAFAQVGLESRIYETIDDLVRILNILIVGFVAWAGFLIAKGDGSGMTRLIYGVVGFLVVNASYLIINYFR